MRAINPPDRYSRGAIAFHWVIAALVVFNLWLGIAHDSLPRDWQVMPVHKAVGITVLVLTFGRIAWRFSHPAPPLPPTVAGFERVAAYVSHYAFYVLLLVMPLTGWAMSSSTKAKPFDWFGVFTVPKLPVSADVSKFGHDAHELLGWGMLALVVLHVAAALRHHFLLRDSVLARMTPGVRPLA
ncbi:MAG: cytochrome b [Pseudomonadota bacterium]